MVQGPATQGQEASCILIEGGCLSWDREKKGWKPKKEVIGYGENWGV